MVKATRAAPKRAPAARPRFDLTLTAALALFGVAAGMVVHFALRDPEAHASTRVETRVDGRALDPTRPLDESARELARDYESASLKLELGTNTHALRRSALGVRVDLAALTELLRAAGDGRSPLRRLHAQERGDAPLSLTIPARLESGPAERWLRSLAEQAAEPAHGPRVVDFRSGKVVQALPGKRLDVQATLDALEEGVARGAERVRARLVALAPRDVGAGVPATVDVSAVLGAFEVTLSASDPVRARNRRRLLHALHGTLLPAGASFDLRAQLAQLEAAAPLEPSKWSALDGDGLAHTIDHFASCLHGAALFAGLPILERHPSARVKAEIEPGLEAIITSQHNLRFLNDFEQPIALAVELRGDKLRVLLRGAPLGAREVELERVVEANTPPEERTRVDATLPLYSSYVVDRGGPALRLRLTRTVRDPMRPEPLREERVELYTAAPRIVRVGSGRAPAGSATVPRGDVRKPIAIADLVVLAMRPGWTLPVAR